MRRRHDPASSYRLQFNSKLRFDDALGLVPYLKALGITDCYASPLLKSATGSEHGYDISDHGALNPTLGTDDDFVRFATALKEQDLGLLLDIVPNHMGLDERSNPWWRDVLRLGPESSYAEYFDIAWTPTPDHPRGRVLLPILEDGYGDVLHRGEIRLVIEQEPVIAYWEHRLPLAPGTLREDVDLAALNGIPGEPSSWDPLHALLEQQWYRLAHWKTSFDEINYRRFFDVNQLGGIRMELDAVFEATHRKVLTLIEEGWVTGLRLDHPDGLLDPARYFERLQSVLAALPAEPGVPERFHVVVEKILARDESLPPAWPVSGTTGYGFLNEVNGVFVDPANEKAMHALYAGVTGRRERFAEVAYRSRQLVAHSSMASELSVLTQALKRLAEADRRTRDFTATALRRALAEMSACMPVYRTYVSETGFSAADREVIDLAIDRARRINPVIAPAAFMFLRQVLLADGDDPQVAERRRFAMKFQQFSAPIQAKGIEDTAFYRDHALVSLNEVGGDPSHFGTPVEAFHAGNAVRLERWPLEMTSTATHDTKRGEDARVRIDVLSQMPAEWRRAVMQWRRINALRRTAVDRAPAPDPNDEYLFYQVLVGAWPPEADGAAVPLEAPAEFVERIKGFMLKAVREGKTHTSWLNQNRAYEDAVAVFIETTLRGTTAARFLKLFVPFARDVARAGMVNSLAQLVLKVASPGIPDFYQGTELWQLDFADPDNRRPVDFEQRRGLLSSMEPGLRHVESGDQPEALVPLFSELLDNWHDGRIKMFITAAALRHRRAWRELFVHGTYRPLQAQGPAAAHIVAFARQHAGRTVVAAVPRLLAGRRHVAEGSPQEAVWNGTTLGVPAGPGEWRHLFTAQRMNVSEDRMPVAALFDRCPVALLVRE